MSRYISRSVSRTVSKSLAALSGACFFTLNASFTRAAAVFPKEGTGPNSAQVIFNWPDAFIADYTINYNSPTGSLDGYSLTQIATADTNLTLVWTDFGNFNAPNYYLNDATYTGGHTSVGLSYSTATPENYWHEYYNNGNGWKWGSGASADTINNSGEIGWVFGSSALPVVPEPGSISLLAAGAAALTYRRRREFMPPA